MWRDNNGAIVFSSNRRDITFIHTVVYEALMELHRDLDRIKEMAKSHEFRRTLRSITSARPLPAKEKLEIPRPDCVVMKLAARTKGDVIREPARKLDGGSIPIRCEEEVLPSIEDRESAASTEFEFNVSMPHGRSDAINHVMAAVGICPEGMDFSCRDGTPVRLMVFAADSKSTSEPHLHFLAGITTSLRTQDMVDAVVAAETPEQIVRLLIGNKSYSLVERFMSGGQP